MITAARTSWSIGLVTPTPAIVNTSGSSKSPGPGGTNSSFEMTTLGAKLTELPLLLFFLPSRQSVEPSNGHVDAEGRAHQDADRDQERGPQPPVREPSQSAVQEHPGDDVSVRVPG